MFQELRDRGFEIMDYPVTKPGFYHNPHKLCIEHWSVPAKWNKGFPVVGEYSCDGFYSFVGVEDIDHFAQIIESWNNFIKREEAR